MILSWEESISCKDPMKSQLTTTKREFRHLRKLKMEETDKVKQLEESRVHGEILRCFMENPRYIKFEIVKYKQRGSRVLP